MAGSYKRYTVNVPPDLARIIEQRIPECPYDSASSYFLALAVFDLWSRRPHRFTAKLMNQPPRIRDEAFAELIKKFEAGKGATEPGWFDHFLKGIVEENLSPAQSAAAAESASNPQDKSKPPGKKRS